MFSFLFIEQPKTFGVLFVYANQLKKVKPEDFNLFLDVPDLYLYLDPELNILNASNGYLKATLTNREAIIGKYFFDVFPDNPLVKNADSVSKLKDSLEFVLKNKVPHEMEVLRYDVPRPKGGFEIKYWKPLNSPVLNQEGDVLYIINKVGDVFSGIKEHQMNTSLILDKEQKHHDDIISLKERRKVIYELALESPVAMAILKGPDYIIEMANPAFFQIWNKQSIEIIGKPLFVGFPELLNQGVKEILDEVFKKGIPYIGKEIPIQVDLPESNKLYYYDVVYHPLLESNGKTYGLTVTGTDVTAVVKANKEIVATKDRFQQLLENLPEITWTSLPSGEINFYNQRWYDYTGLSFEETKRWGWDKVVHPEDFANTMKVYMEAISAEKLYEVELRLKQGSTNTYRWHLARAIPFRNPKGVVTFWVGTTTDIHALKSAEVELTQLRQREKILLEQSESERKRLFSLFMDAPAMVCVLRQPNHVFELVNPLFQKLYGDRQLLGKPIQDALPEFKDQGIFELLDEVYKTGIPYVGKEIPWLIEGEKEQRYFNFIYKAAYGNEDAVNGILGFGYEVTDQVVNRKYLEESEQRLRLAQEAANIGTFEWNLSTDVIKFTPQVEIIFGYAPGEWKGNYANALKTIHPDDLERIRQENEEAIKERKNLNIEHRIIRPNGEIRWINSKGEMICDTSGKGIKVVGVILDITERKEAEQAIQRTNQELIHMNTDLDNFIYTASHDLKAPISNLEGLLNAFSIDANFNEEQEALVGMMFQSIERFKTTIKDLTEISKVQRTAQEDFDTLSFSEIWNEVKLDITELIERFHPEIETNFNIDEIKYFRKNLRSIIYNIVSNAIKYSSPDRNPFIRISTERKENCIILKVSDNGLGLSSQDKDKVFGMFKRAHQHVEGTGIGLYVIKRMVENFGGKIEVQSELGKGSTFIVYFKEC